jgi:hypothetical protein
MNQEELGQRGEDIVVYQFWGYTIEAFQKVFMFLGLGFVMGIKDQLTSRGIDYSLFKSYYRFERRTREWIVRR